MSTACLCIDDKLCAFADDGQEERGIGKVMKSLGRSYAEYFNYQYGRAGT